MDIGTGSGRSVLRRAARETGTLFIGLDADAAAMSETSRRAARPVRKGGQENVLFLAAAAEELPGVLCGRADELTLALPWGSLLRAVLEPDRRAIDAIAACVASGGTMTFLVSSAPGDGVPRLLVTEDHARALQECYEQLEFRVELHRASATDVATLSSGWGRRLGIPAHRAAWVYRLTR